MPSANLGNVGPQQGEAVSFDWKWSYSAPGYVIWLVLILAIVLPKANRDPRILLIFVPLLIVNLFWMIFKKVSNMPSSSASQFDTLFYSMAVGIAVLWLVVRYFDKFRGFVRFLLSFITMVIVAGLGILSYSTEFSNDVALLLTLFAFLAITLLVAITTSGKLFNKSYQPFQFMLWLAFFILLVSIVAMIGVIIVVILFISPGEPDFIGMFAFAIEKGLLFGLCLYFLNLPFMLLGFANPFFRERFCACLCPKSMPTATAQSYTNQPNEEQSSDLQRPEDGGSVSETPIE